MAFLANKSPLESGHVHPDTQMAKILDRSSQDLEADSIMQRHFMFNLLAALVQLPRDSSILATHLYCPGQLQYTWPLGSTRHERIEFVHYDCGVRLSEDYEMLNAREPLQDPASAYFVTLISWGALLWSHTLFPESHTAMYGPVMSQRSIDDRIPGATDHAWLSKFILMRIEASWLGLQFKAGISADLRSLVLNRALEEMLLAPAVAQADRHVFASRNQRLPYETALRDAFFVAYNSR